MKIDGFSVTSRMPSGNNAKNNIIPHSMTLHVAEATGPAAMTRAHLIAARVARLAAWQQQCGQRQQPCRMHPEVGWNEWVWEGRDMG